LSPCNLLDVTNSPPLETPSEGETYKVCVYAV
jgi:hypothetical protein